MDILITSLIIPVALVLIFRFLNTSQKRPILGVFQQPNKYYWFKFCFMYTYLQLRQWFSHLWRLTVVEDKSSDGTIHVYEQDAVLEQKYDFGSFPMKRAGKKLTDCQSIPNFLQQLQEHVYGMIKLLSIKAVDAVYFNGMSKEGVAVITGVARRPRNCDAFMYLKVDGEELLLSPTLPDTYLTQTPEENGEYSVEGISITNFIPMRTWKVFYKGDMKYRNNENEKVKVEVDLTWSAHWPYFNYDTQISPRGMARDMAKEQWSSDYFKLLKKAHQTHYEQMGFLKGNVSINGKEQFIRIPCVRDHSFGEHRNWRNFHRYVYHFIFLENGDCMAIGTVSQPIILSHLTIGYLCLKSDQHEVFAVDTCDFQLYQHGENKIMPKDYAFTFKAGGKSYTVRVEAKDETFFYIGKDREAKIHERWSKVQVNDVNGWACVECHYNNTAE